MSLNSIKEGALFIADAHYPNHSKEFLDLLYALEEGKIKTPQLFLMGDIFDLLFAWCGDYILSFSIEAIESLQRLSNSLEIHYFEGNHDFRLKRLFKNIHIYPREEQAIFMKYNNKKIALSHGDRYEVGFGYNFYSYLLRRSPLMCLLKPWEHKVIDYQMKQLSSKDICHKYKGFEKKIKKILSHYPNSVDLVIEGHFHQGKIFEHYISLPSFACEKRVGVMRRDSIEFLRVEELF